MLKLLSQENKTQRGRMAYNNVYTKDHENPSSNSKLLRPAFLIK
jgi:hypothetical protein